MPPNRVVSAPRSHFAPPNRRAGGTNCDRNTYLPTRSGTNCDRNTYLPTTRPHTIRTPALGTLRR